MKIIKSFNRICRKAIMKNRNVRLVAAELLIPMIALLTHFIIKKKWNI